MTASQLSAALCMDVFAKDGSLYGAHLFQKAPMGGDAGFNTDGLRKTATNATSPATRLNSLTPLQSALPETRL